MQQRNEQTRSQNQFGNERPNGTQQINSRAESMGQAQYPRQQVAETRGGNAEPPLLLFDFFGNNTSSGTPLDNHLAVSNEGQIVSVINRHIATKDEAGDWVSGGAFTLEKFIKDLPDSLGVDEEDAFDPRVLYDLENDRFIIFMINVNLICLASHTSHSKQVAYFNAKRFFSPM